jgi:YHS domain-containing protein
MYFRVIVFIILIYLIFRVIKSIKRVRLARGDSARDIHPRASGEDLIEDPVCRTHIPVSQAYTKEIAGKIYYFCGKECCEKFMLSKNG